MSAPVRQRFRILYRRSSEDLLQLLVETLGVEFRKGEASWRSETYGGSRFELTRDGDQEYTLILDHDPQHPMFSSQEKSFVRVERFPEWLPLVLGKEEAECTFMGGC